MLAAGVVRLALVQVGDEVRRETSSFNGRIRDELDSYAVRGRREEEWLGWKQRFTLPLKFFFFFFFQRNEKRNPYCILHTASRFRLSSRNRRHTQFSCPEFECCIEPENNSEKTSSRITSMLNVVKFRKIWYPSSASISHTQFFDDG